MNMASSTDAAASRANSLSERITVGLTKRASQELLDLADESGLSKTDLVNRAVSLYRLITDKADHGYQLAFVGQKGELQIVHIL